MVHLVEVVGVVVYLGVGCVCGVFFPGLGYGSGVR